MEITEELKPCPFCGGTAERVDIEDGDDAGGSFICCTVCQASGNIEFGFKENFVSNWNRRAAIAGQAAALQVDGWQIVPVEPTLRMQNAGWREIDAQGFQTEDTEVAPIYRAMLASAPKPGDAHE